MSDEDIIEKLEKLEENFTDLRKYVNELEDDAENDSKRLEKLEAKFLPNFTSNDLEDMIKFDETINQRVNELEAKLEVSTEQTEKKEPCCSKCSRKDTHYCNYSEKEAPVIKEEDKQGVCKAKPSLLTRLGPAEPFIKTKKVESFIKTLKEQGLENAINKAEVDKEQGAEPFDKNIVIPIKEWERLKNIEARMINKKRTEPKIIQWVEDEFKGREKKEQTDCSKDCRLVIATMNVIAHHKLLKEVEKEYELLEK